MEMKEMGRQGWKLGWQSDGKGPSAHEATNTTAKLQDAKMRTYGKTGKQNVLAMPVYLYESAYWNWIQTGMAIRRGHKRPGTHHQRAKGSGNRNVSLRRPTMTDAAGTLLQPAGPNVFAHDYNWITLPPGHSCWVK